MTEKSERLAGYEVWGDIDPFEEVAGPFYFKQLESGDILCAFEATRQHLNGQGNVHGGALMSFADFALFAIARPALLPDKAVTVSFTSEFISPGHAGDFIEASGDIIKSGRSMIFVRGLIYTTRPGMEHPEILLNFSGTLKKFGRRSA